ncbi:hypothetical protein Tco_1579271 [Tanacetum coccineum]
MLDEARSFGDLGFLIWGFQFRVLDFLKGVYVRLYEEFIMGATIGTPPGPPNLVGIEFVITFHAKVFTLMGTYRIHLVFNSPFGNCFNSFYNLAIDEIPLRVGRFCVANFNSYTYKLFLDSGDSIHVTHSKIHDILGIPVGGISLFSLEARPVEHEFVKSWVDQFSPKTLKKIRVGDIASKLIFAHKVDFLFKVNFPTLFSNTIGRVAGLKGEIYLDVVRRLREDSDISKIDWCGYIHSCLEDSKIPKK